MDQEQLSENLKEMKSALMMHVFLISWAHDQANAASTDSVAAAAAAATTTAKAKAKGKSAKVSHLLDEWDWEVQREKLLRAIAASLSVDLRRLCGGRVPEDLLSTSCRSAWKALEQPAIALVKGKATRDASIAIIAGAIQHGEYRNTIATQVRVVEPERPPPSTPCTSPPHPL
jgi:hypothetical protein